MQNLRRPRTPSRLNFSPRRARCENRQPRPGCPTGVSTSRTLDAAFLPKAESRPSLSREASPTPTTSRPTNARKLGRTMRFTPLPTASCCSPEVARYRWRHDYNRQKQFASIASPTTAFAEANVKSTYSDLKEQPNGALLASASPIHVTAAKMTAHTLRHRSVRGQRPPVAGMPTWSRLPPFSSTVTAFSRGPGNRGAPGLHRAGSGETGAA